MLQMCTKSKGNTNWHYENADIYVFNLAAPSIPVISGSHRVRRGETTTLTCNSVSRSRPDYYKKFATIAYAWFVNELEVTQGVKSLELTVHTHTTVECQAKEDLTSTSEPFYIEALCKQKFYFLYICPIITFANHAHTSQIY